MADGELRLLLLHGLCRQGVGLALDLSNVSEFCDLKMNDMKE